jgi:hypothetical protein
MLWKLFMLKKIILSSQNRNQNWYNDPSETENQDEIRMKVLCFKSNVAKL